MYIVGLTIYTFMENHPYGFAIIVGVIIAGAVYLVSELTLLLDDKTTPAIKSIRHQRALSNLLQYLLTLLSIYLVCRAWTKYIPSGDVDLTDQQLRHTSLITIGITALILAFLLLILREFQKRISSYTNELTNLYNQEEAKTILAQQNREGDSQAHSQQREYFIHLLKNDRNL